MQNAAVYSEPSLSKRGKDPLYLLSEPIELFGTKLVYQLFDSEIRACSFADFAALKSLLGAASGHNYLPVEQAIAAIGRQSLSRLQTAGLVGRSIPVAPPAKLPPHRLSDIEINISQVCNMGCDYCCVGKGLFGREAHRMTTQTVCRALDQLVARSEAKVHGVTFFGGEPLLNFKVMEEAVAYAKRIASTKNRMFTFRILTNGTAFTNEKVRFLTENDFAIQISLDGDRNVHDKWRTTVNGLGTYDRIVAALDRYFQNYKDKITLRATMSKGNLNALTAFHSLEALGFSNIIVSHANGRFFSSQYDSSEVEQLKTGYSDLATMFLDRALSTRRVSSIGAPFNEYLRVLASGSRKGSYCGAGVRFVGLSSRGEYAFCQDLADEPMAGAGSVEQGLDEKAIGSYLKRSASVDSRPICNDCWARYACGGGCMALAITQNRSIEKPYLPDCEMIRHNLALSAWMMHRLQAECPEAFLDEEWAQHGA